MKMFHSLNREEGKIKKSSSCKELSALSKESGISFTGSSSSFKSADDLPAAVAECFQDTSFVGRIQNSFLVFLGRGNRYKIKSTKGCSLLSMIVPKKNNDYIPPRPVLLSPMDENSSEASKSPPVTPSNFQMNPLLNRPKASSTPVHKKSVKQKQNQRNEMREQPKEESKFSYTGREDRSPKEEETLLRQYMSLQQLAIARRHCNQLRRIRDSLAGRSRPKAVNVPPSQEQEELRNFLLDVGFVQYYSLLNRHGYDFTTASHMDVLDLAAVGINEPLHRMALKYELDQVRCPVVPLKSIPESIEQWLRDISLPEYIEHFQQNGFFCPLAAVGLTKRELQLMGIYMLGHRKKLVLALLAINMSLNSKDYSRQKVS